MENFLMHTGIVFLNFEPSDFSKNEWIELFENALPLTLEQQSLENCRMGRKQNDPRFYDSDEWLDIWVFSKEEPKVKEEEEDDEYSGLDAFSNYKTFGLSPEIFY